MTDETAQVTSNPLCKRCGGPIGPGSDHEEDPCMEIYIARLEAEIERLEECIRGMSAHAMKAAAEETRLRAALEMINMLACYASEEDTDSRAAVLLQIGKLARGEVSPAIPEKRDG